MWRVDHDSVRHKLHARKPMVMTKENIRLKKGVPTKVLWQRQGDAIPPEPAKVAPPVAPPPANGPKPESKAKGATEAS